MYKPNELTKLEFEVLKDTLFKRRRRVVNALDRSISPGQAEGILKEIAAIDSLIERFGLDPLTVRGILSG